MISKLIKIIFFKDLSKRMLETSYSQTPVKFKMWFYQRVLGFNKEAYWPMHFTSIVTGVKNIYAGIDTSPGYMPGCYIQGIGKIYIGDYSQISSNVGIITANHDIYDTRKHEVKSVVIGKYCWIGMNSMILPGVELGDFTIVGAGSVVTKSFSEGYCIIAGNPARVIKKIDKEKCKPFKNDYEYHGYLNTHEFNEYKDKYLNV